MKSLLLFSFVLFFLSIEAHFNGAAKNEVIGHDDHVSPQDQDDHVPQQDQDDHVPQQDQDEQPPPPPLDQDGEHGEHGEDDEDDEHRHHRHHHRHHHNHKHHGHHRHHHHHHYDGHPVPPPPPPPLNRELDMNQLKTGELAAKSDLEIDSKRVGHASISGNWKKETREAEMDQSANGDKKTLARTIDENGGINAEIDFNSKLGFLNKNEITGKGMKEFSLNALKNSGKSKHFKSWKREKREVVQDNNFGVGGDGAVESKTDTTTSGPTIQPEREKKVKNFFSSVKKVVEKGKELFQKAGTAIKGAFEDVFGGDKKQ